MSTRNGKIARLPRSVREELNRRLEDGEEGKAIVVWLNGHELVRSVLERLFGGRPISEQNLSQWRQGGFQDWRRHQDALEWTRSLAEESDELEDAAGDLPLSDSLGPVIALTLGKMLRSAARDAEEDPERRGEVLSLAREIAQLRRDDHRAARLRLDLEKDEIEAEDKALAERDRHEHMMEWAPVRALQNLQMKYHVTDTLTKGMSTEARNRFRDLMGLRPFPVPEAAHDPSESDQIRVNHTQSK